MDTFPHACVITLFLFLSSLDVCAQSGAGSVKMTGQVSAAVAVSIPEGRSLSDQAQVSIANLNAETIAVSISNSGNDEAQVSLPVQLRSNASYSLEASFLSSEALAVRMSIAGVRPTGKFVRADAVEAIKIEEALAAPQGESAPLLTVQNRPLPVAILRGSSISKAGTFTSSDNAIEVVLSIKIQPPVSGKGWSTRLTISATPSR